MTHPKLADAAPFVSRHIGPSPADLQQMLSTVGVGSLDELIDQAVPAAIRRSTPLNVPAPLSEPEMVALLRELASQNQVKKSFIGMGYYGTHVPGVIQRNILENPGWYTQYTPYQAEIAQGRLEALLNFQTMVMELTGMDIANASLLDEGTAAAEAMALFYNATKGEAKKFWVSENTHPQTLAVLQTRAEPLGIALVEDDPRDFAIDESYFGAMVQYPGTDGHVLDIRPLIEKAHAVGARVVVASDLLALTLLTPPGEMGADIVVGSAQRFGIPLGYGGPHPAFFATKDEFKRVLPGRLVGVSLDTQGQPALRLALQTREQHIRREKATSNICTAQVLLAVMAGMYAVYHGPARLKAIAERVHFLTRVLAQGLSKSGYHLGNQDYFDTLRIYIADNAGIKSQFIQKRTENAGFNLRFYEDFSIGISLDETATEQDIFTLINLFHDAEYGHAADYKPEQLFPAAAKAELPAALQRKSAFMQQQVFNRYHTEHEMLRYIHKLESRDLSLNYSMIPLGSCTMKLNATTEMVALTWPEFANIHPFAPKEQAAGYAQVFKELEKYLADITGFAGISLQPNSGAQGEYAGLMVIRAYQKAQGESHRDIALIPSSAHGTNPASAVMAGMQVVVVKCDDQANIDHDDLRAKVEQYSDRLSCLMITYPSTFGVFEERIPEVCALIHQHGGQVYMDGANLNAQVGLTSPGQIGADVCHLNLHKTFCIPHGGGGPGMGPIGVASHLVPFLPGHPVVETGGSQSISPVSAGPWGSALILLISYTYIRMMGPKGLVDATKYAILNANYLKERVATAYPILYSGANGRVAHEFIVDARGFKKYGIEVEDLAKRLIDYGYHAPTMSWPVPGTMMIEPTESESLHELDRFVEALLQIRAEIAEVEAGTADREDNVLKNSPHTAEMVISDRWAHAYSREKAAFPVLTVRHNKFWPAVGRVNNSYGDRNLVCSCTPLEAYMAQPAETEAVGV